MLGVSEGVSVIVGDGVIVKDGVMVGVRVGFRLVMSSLYNINGPTGPLNGTQLYKRSLK